MLTNSTHYPADGFPYFTIFVLEHLQQILKSLNYDFKELLFIWSFGNWAQCHQRCIFVFPAVKLYVGCYELNHRIHHMISHQNSELLKTTSCWKSMSPFFIIFIFFKVNDLQSSKNKQKQFIFAFFNILFTRIFGSSLCLFFGKCGPELKGLCADLIVFTLCCCCRCLADLFEIKLDELIFLSSDFSEAVQSALLDLLVWWRTSCEYFGHDEVSFLLHLEIRCRIGNTVQQSFDRKSGRLRCFLAVHDVVCQS